MSYYRVGSRVRIAKCCCKRCSRNKKRTHDGAPGRIVKISRQWGTRCPMIRLNDRSAILWGFECWWVTERTHRETVAKLGRGTATP